MAKVDWTRARIWLQPGAWTYLLFSFDGRISRLPFWIAVIVLNIAAYFADRIAFDFGGNPASAVVGLAFLYPSLAIATKRTHDRGRSELYLLVFFLPAFLVSLLQVLGYMDGDSASSPFMALLGIAVIASIIILVIDLGLMPGERGQNRFGPDPL
jgi:uncharacterized membrane protein YhaH (DUF805 family)